VLLEDGQHVAVRLPTYYRLEPLEQRVGIVDCDKADEAEARLHRIMLGKMGWRKVREQGWQF
jgi:hypothetical protein